MTREEALAILQPLRADPAVDAAVEALVAEISLVRLRLRTADHEMAEAFRSIRRFRDAASVIAPISARAADEATIPGALLSDWICEWLTAAVKRGWQ